jgi:N-acetylmuramoyl-L-alanine amidase
VRFFLLFSLTLLISGIFAQNAFAQQGLAVNSLRIGTHPDNTRIVIELSHKADFRAFTLQNPSRLVIDLPAFDWQAGAPPRPPGSLVSTIRNGLLQPGVSRIVIELQTQATLKNAFFLPSGPSISDRVVIDFARAPKGWSPTQERMFGSLNSQAPQFHLEPQTKPAQNTSGVLQLPRQKPIIEEEKTVAPDMPPVVRSSKGPKPMIVIDAGHGGDDPGALGANGTKEKTVTLAAAKELKEKLESSGRYRVHLTRSGDKFIKLQDRVKIGRTQGADLFISLHADSIDKPGVSGASIYTLSNTASDAQTAKLAARENRADLIAGVDLSHEDKEVANILIDLAMRDTMNQSKFFANTIVKQAQRQGIELLEKPHRFAGFAVLKAPDIPSVLIEMGFMSNKREVSQLSSPAYRAKIVTAIAGGIDSYFAKVQKNGQN